MREINLLPPARRQRLRRETMLIAARYVLTGLATGLTVLTVAGVAAAVVLWLVSLSMGRTAVSLKAAQDEYKTWREAAEQRNQFYNHIELVGRERFVWSELMLRTLGAVPAGARVETISAKSLLDKGQPGEASVIVRGRAATRAALKVFEDRLRALSDVVEVVSPNSNWLERNNPTYEFTVKYKGK